MARFPAGGGVAAALALAALAAGCSGGSSSGAGGGSVAAGAARHGAAGQEALGRLTPAPKQAQEAAATLPSSVIKTARISLSTAGPVERVARRAGSIAGGLGGYVAGTAVERHGQHSARLVLRVPAQRFETAVARLEALGHVRAAESAGRDVGGRLVDLGARLRNARAQERALLRLMRRADTVKATLRVQGVLAGVQLQIEELGGQLRFLRRRAALGTIELEIAPAGQAPAAPPGRLADALGRAGDAIVSVVAGAIVVAGFALPLLVLAAVAAALGALALRRRPRAAPPPAEP